MSCVFVTDRLDVVSQLRIAGLGPVLYVPPRVPIEVEVTADLVVWVECRATAARGWPNAAHLVAGWHPDDGEPYPDRGYAEIVKDVVAQLADYSLGPVHDDERPPLDPAEVDRLGAPEANVLRWARGERDPT